MFLRKIYEHTGNPNGDALYHYTTNSGILGIFNTWQLWATKIRFTNDSREFVHAIDLAKKCLRKIQDQRMEVSDQTFREIERAFDSIKNVHVCIVSFTENPDLLSQWRGYGSGSGYAIGFGIESLVEVANKQGFYLAKCIYDKELQIKLIDEFVTNEVSNQIGKQFPDYLKIASELCQIAALMKDEGFKEENEWRLFSGTLSSTDPNFQFRLGLNTLIPYYALNLTHESQKVKVKKIICGPNPNSELAKDAIYSLIVKNGYYDLPIVNSSIPYRKW